MNLQEFLDHKTECPMCGAHNLSLTFHSSRKQKHTISDNRYLVLFEMKALKKQKDYWIGFSFNPSDNDFYIEFYTKDMVNLYDQINISLLERFKEFFENLGVFKLYRTCKTCNKYNYTSSEFFLDFSTGKMSSCEIKSEYFGMAIPYSDSACNSHYNIYRLSNFPTEKRSFLIYFLTENDLDSVVKSVPPMGSSFIDLPLIKFVSENETAARIKKLLVFS